MDGLLLNTEDIYSLCANNVLARYSRPPLPWSIKAQLMGVSGSSSGDIFYAWAQLPIPREQWAKEQFEEQQRHFPDSQPLPGAAKLLDDLKVAKTVGRGQAVQVALATSSQTENFRLKTGRPEIAKMFEVFAPERRILGEDPRLGKGRGKPRPDIYLLALQVINSSLQEGEPKITPEECLVFEDSVPGVESGRRAGMRVVWVPHPELAKEYRGREEEVLAGRTGLVEGVGEEEQLGNAGDGWAVQVESLEGFDLGRYGIEIPGGLSGPPESAKEGQVRSVDT